MSAKYALIAIAISFLLLSGCLETLFPYGLPGQDNPDPRASATENSTVSPPPQPQPTPPTPSKPNATAAPETQNITIENTSANQTTQNASLAANITKLPNATLNETLPNATLPNATAGIVKSDADYPLQIIFFDVGFGDAALIRRGNFTLLLDSGPAERADSLVAKLSAAGVNQIDIFALSTWNDDDAGGAVKVLSKFPASLMWHNNYTGDSNTSKAAMASLAKSSIASHYPELGSLYSFGDLKFDFLLPQHIRASGNANLNSLVFQLRRGSFCAIFTGAMEEEIEPILLSAMKNSSPCQLYKFPNHGAGRPTPSLLFEKLSPEVAVISVGPNSLDLPKSTTLARLQLRGIPVWQTDTAGDIYVRVNASGAYTVGPVNYSKLD